MKSSSPRTRPLAWLTLALLAGCQDRPHRRFVFSADAPSRTGLVSTDVAGAGTGAGALMGDEAGALVSLDASGHPRWRLELEKEVAAAPLVLPQGVAVAGTLGGDWVGVDVETGHERWHLRAQEPLTALASDGTRVFAAGVQGSVRALDPLTGETLWRKARPVPASAGPPNAALVAFPGLVVGSSGGQLFALRAEDGASVWKVPQLRVLGLLAQEGRLLASTSDEKLLSLEPQTGAIQTLRPLGAPAVGAPCVAAGNVWVGLDNDTLASFELDTLAPQPPRKLPARMSGCPVLFRDFLAVPTDGREGRLELFPDKALRAAFSLRLDSPLRSKPLGMGAWLWVPSRDGRVTGYQLPARPAVTRAGP